MDEDDIVLECSMGPCSYCFPEEGGDALDVELAEFRNECEADEDKTPAPAPCRHFFGVNRYCKFDDKCPFSHDETVFLQFHQLQRCGNFRQCSQYSKRQFCRRCLARRFKPCKNATNNGCTTEVSINYKRDGYCKECHWLVTSFLCAGTTACGNRVREEGQLCRTCSKRQPRKQHEQRELRTCEGHACGTLTRFTYCDDCRAVNERYVVRR